MRLEEPHILFPMLLEVVRKRKGKCAARRTAHSLSLLLGDATREAENGRFLEPRCILSAFSWEVVYDRQRECGFRSLYIIYISTSQGDDSNL